jgi:hypothetical protein
MTGLGGGAVFCFPLVDMAAPADFELNEFMADGGTVKDKIREHEQSI